MYSRFAYKPVYKRFTLSKSGLKTEYQNYHHYTFQWQGPITMHTASWKLQGFPTFLTQSPFLDFAHRTKIKKYDISNAGSASVFR